MRSFINPGRDDRRLPTGSPARGTSDGSTGVHGWLLVLCVMLVVVGPLISIWRVATGFDGMAVRFATSRGAQWATMLNIALTTGSIVFGIHAGYRLWAITPGAVSIARASLLFALVVDILTTTISTAMGAAPQAGAGLFDDVLLDLIPSVAFFTICLAYLNKSQRVEMTYRSLA